VILILATAALTAVALAAAPRLESKGPGPESKGASSESKGQPRPSPAEPGGPLPSSSLPGWHLTYSTHFDGKSLPAGWSAYSGEPGSDPYGYWDPANVTVSNGELHLRTKANPHQPDTYSTGGVGFYGDTQEYGMYLVRMKGDYEPHLQISNIVLLWPASQGVWPPEIDFYEDGGGSRGTYMASLHPGHDGYDCCVVRHSRSGTGTQWHTYGVIWTPTSITYTLDGKQWAKVQASQVSSPGSWPAMPMNLDLQSQNLGPAQPAHSIETMTVAWVAEYAPSS
jgi:beta-glucanase (GH16 family)